MNILERNREQYRLRERLQKARFEAKFCIERIEYLNRAYQQQFEPDLFDLLFESTK